MAIAHFNSQKERLAYLKGNFEEIIPVEAEKEPKKAEEQAEEPKKTKKKAKKSKKEDKNGGIQAE